MMHYLWRAGIAIFVYLAFFYLAPLFLNVIDLTVDGDVWALLKGLFAFGCIAYVIWGGQRWPWATSPPS